MRADDGAQQLDFASQGQGARTPQIPVAGLSVLHATPPAISLADRLKAVGLIVLTGTVGIGVVLLGRSLWSLNTEDVVLPLTADTDFRSQPDPLRDRLQVLTPDAQEKTPSEPVQSIPLESTRSVRSRQSLQASLPRISHGFGTLEEPAELEEESEIAADAGGLEEATEEATDPSAPASTSFSTQTPDESSDPSLEASPGESPEASETTADEPTRAIADLPAETSKPTAQEVDQAAALDNAITALLQAPQPISASVAIAPPSVLLALPDPSTLEVVPEISEQPAIEQPTSSTATSPLDPIESAIAPEPLIPSTPSTLTSAPEAIPESISAPIASTPSTAISTPESTPTSILPSLSLLTPPEAITSTPTDPASTAETLPEAITSTSSNSTSTTETPPETAALAIPPVLQEGVYIERIAITGNTRFSEQQLAAVVQKVIAGQSAEATSDTESAAANVDPTVLNRKVPLAALVQASEAITQLYVKEGYINSGAYVPAEVLDGASPEIRVVEGKLEAINIQEIKRPGFLWLAQPLSPKYVQHRLARSIRFPLQIDQLADAVRVLEQDPLIASISTELAPGTTTGSSILNVKVRQASPLQTSLSVDNGRSPSVGRFRQQFALNHANLLGLGDTLQVGYNRSEGSRGWNIGYTLPINAKNGTLSFNYSNNRGEVIEEPFRDLDIRSRSQNYELALRQPIKQTSTELLALNLRANHYRNEGVFLETFNNGVPLPLPGRGSDPNGETRITALRFGQEWLKRGERDVISLQSDFSVGISALGATRLDIPPDGRFLSWQGRAFWVHSFAPDTLLSVKGQLQFANRPLVPVEQMSLGGMDTVRGYRTSTLLSDNGAFASAEFYLPVLRIPEWKSVVQVVPFFDIGRGWNQGDAEPVPNFLMSTGLGLQWKVSDNFRARIDWGIPLVNSNLNGQSLKEGLFFSVTFTP